MQNDTCVLTEDERTELLNTATRLAEGYEIEACCAYGSKVSGYARPDSDYDILLILKNYEDKIKYVYAHDKIEASVLIVDDKAFFDDAKRASLGEFVAGRLLHPYEPLINSEYLENIESLYKKRVVMEELRELATINPLYTELRIPVEYFLFAKIKKRAKVYPHALYSYVKTYSGAIRSKNIEFSKKGFIRALLSLEDEGYVRLEDGDVRVKEIKVRINEKVSLDFANVIRGTRAYLVHGYAGRKTLNFFKQEALSKLNRRKEISELPEEFRDPSVMLKLREGLLVHGDQWLDAVAKELGFNEYSMKRDKLGDPYAATSLYTINGNGKSEKIVVKHFASIKAIKWTALNFWVAGLQKFEVDPSMRLRNEYRAMLILKDLGLYTPDIIAISIDNRMLVTRYVEGILLSDIIDAILNGRSDDTSMITKFGSILYELHNKGFTMVDTKPSNMIVHNGKIFITDLEQFSRNKNKSWDLVCFIYFSLLFTKNEDAARKIVRAFLDGYIHDDRSLIIKALSKKYLPPFYPAMVLDVMNAVRDEMRSYIK